MIDSFMTGEPCTFMSQKLFWRDRNLFFAFSLFELTEKDNVITSTKNRRIIYWHKATN